MKTVAITAGCAAVLCGGGAAYAVTGDIGAGLGGQELAAALAALAGMAALAAAALSRKPRRKPVRVRVETERDQERGRYGR